MASPFLIVVIILSLVTHSSKSALVAVLIIDLLYGHSYPKMKTVRYLIQQTI